MKNKENKTNEKEIEYKKTVEEIKKRCEEYYAERFKDCHPEAKELARNIFDTIYTNAMLIFQDFPDAQTKNAAISFFTFACRIFEASIAEKFHKDIAKDKLPKIKPTKKRSDLIKSILSDIEKGCSIVGYELAKNLLDRDFAYFFALIKDLQIENQTITDLLLSHFRMYTWIGIGHIKVSESKKEGHA